jgi:hypothetical protein
MDGRFSTACLFVKVWVTLLGALAGSLALLPSSASAANLVENSWFEKPCFKVESCTKPNPPAAWGWEGAEGSAEPFSPPGNPEYERVFGKFKKATESCLGNSACAERADHEFEQEYEELGEAREGRGISIGGEPGDGVAQHVPTTKHWHYRLSLYVGGLGEEPSPYHGELTDEENQEIKQRKEENEEKYDREYNDGFGGHEYYENWPAGKHCRYKVRPIQEGDHVASKSDGEGPWSDKYTIAVKFGNGVVEQVPVEFLSSLDGDQNAGGTGSKYWIHTQVEVVATSSREQLSVETQSSDPSEEPAECGPSIDAVTLEPTQEISKPIVHGVSPHRGTAGTTVTISGENFEPNAEVRFGSTRATTVTVNPDEHSITAVAPEVPSGGRVDVTVTTPGEAEGTSDTSSEDTFSFNPAPEEVFTKPATDIEKNTVRLNGEVDPEGERLTTCRFEYGPVLKPGEEPHYTESAGCEGLGEFKGDSLEAHSAPVGNEFLDHDKPLIPGTEYVFRFVAGVATGTKDGAPMYFTTLPESPSPVTTGWPKAVAPYSATVTGSVDPDGHEVTRCEVEYGPTTSYGSAAPCEPMPGASQAAVKISAKLTGLTARTAYHYRVIASNAGGTSEGNDESFLSEYAGEFGQCAKAASKGLGRYGNSGCTAQGGSDGYEWQSIGDISGEHEVVTTSASKARPEFEWSEVRRRRSGEAYIANGAMVCSGEESLAGQGVVSGPSEIRGLVLRFKHCVARGDEECSSDGAPDGEIVSMPLEATLGVLELGMTSAENKLGMALSSEEGSMMAFSCSGGLSGEVSGSVIAPITANKMTHSFKVSFAQSKGKQKQEAFVDGPASVLNLFGNQFGPTGLKLDMTVSLKGPATEKLELNSVL